MRETHGTRASTIERHLATRIPATYDLLAAGNTEGVFQVESGGMTELVVQASSPAPSRSSSPSWRSTGPGPLGSGMVDDFINRKNGLTKHRVPAARARRAHGRDPGRDRLPGPGPADRQPAGGLQPGRGRPAASGHGQEEARGDGRSRPCASSVRRRRARHRREEGPRRSSR